MALAVTDVGWHLLSVLERISRIAGRELQRIGLSATVGNPEALVDWLAGSCTGTRSISAPPASGRAADAEVRLDYVGSLPNAALVVARLHRGEKRLVFVDSRSKAEQLSSELRQLGVTTFVTHSSLSQEQRLHAERAFAERTDCVIVATSVLELGIDVGDLDRVIQIDAPPAVASFLQRMGRTGRRPGTTRNCLFLATSDAMLIRAAGLIHLWSEGYVEPIVPPPEPYHILAQQVMALALQEQGIGISELLEWIGNVPGFAQIAPGRFQEIVRGMLREQILWSEQGILGLGQKGEENYGRRNFLALFSVFVSPPLFTIQHGRRELGSVDVMTFLDKKEGPRILLLGGRAWLVNHVDWPRRIAYVEPAEAQGRSRWKGQGQGLSQAMSQAIRRVIISDDQQDPWSQRARERIAAIRMEYSWLTPRGSVVLIGLATGTEWWTFAGSRANATLAGELSRRTGSRVDHDAFVLTFEPRITDTEIENAIALLRAEEPRSLRPSIDEGAIEGLKFSECLPRELALEMLQTRLRDEAGIRSLLAGEVGFTSCELE